MGQISIILDAITESPLFSIRSPRNRLESNAEHWNALLLSLRELIEWVIRKDTELTGLGPVCGDIATLQKQQASYLIMVILY